jgi:hypothetical protein
MRIFESVVTRCALGGLAVYIDVAILTSSLQSFGQLSWQVFVSHLHNPNSNGIHFSTSRQSHELKHRGEDALNSSHSLISSLVGSYL